MKTKAILAIFLLSFLFIPAYALDMAVLSFSQNVSEILPVFTADKAEVLITSFSAEKNEIKEVPVYINDVVNLSEAVIFVKYDNSIIEPENVSNGDFNISYAVEDGIKITLDLNETFTGDFLLAEIVFKVIGEEGESTALNIEVDKFLDNNSNEIPYLIINGMFYIPIKDREEKEGGGNDKIGKDLSGLINAENKSKFADENNLEFKDNKVRVIIETDNTTEDKFVDIDDLLDLANNDTIKNIRAYRKILNKELIIIGLIALAVIVMVLIILKFLKRK